MVFHLYTQYRKNKMAFKTITIGDYLVKEPTVGVIMPLMDTLSEDPRGFQQSLAKACIFVAGSPEPIGDGLNSLPISDYIALQAAVMEVSGFGDSGK